MTDHTGKPYHAPQPFKVNLDFVQAISRAISRKVKGSANHKRANWQRNRTYKRVADQRRDFHYKLAHALCDVYDHLYFEDLTLEGMKRRWGRKVSDLGFGQFLKILEWVALKLGKTVTKIAPFTPTSQLCSQCGHRQKLSLADRVFNCQKCYLKLDRDHNAARNILRTGASVPTERGLRKSSATV